MNSIRYTFGNRSSKYRARAIRQARELGLAQVTRIVVDPRGHLLRSDVIEVAA